VRQSGDDKVHAVQRGRLEPPQRQTGIGKGKVRVNGGQRASGVRIREQGRRPEARMPFA
jgi:hypothetical protein